MQCHNFLRRSQMQFRIPKAFHSRPHTHTCQTLPFTGCWIYTFIAKSKFNVDIPAWMRARSFSSAIPAKYQNETGSYQMLVTRCSSRTQKPNPELTVSCSHRIIDKSYTPEVYLEVSCKPIRSSQIPPSKHTLWVILLIWPLWNHYMRVLLP